MATPSIPTALDEVRLAILRQHTQLAQLFDELEQAANEVVLGARRESARAFDDALEIVHTRFCRHLDYEEAHLASLLTSAAAASLLGDHRDQRARANGLLHDRDVYRDDRPTLARAALAFVHLIRKDMADEERMLRALR